MSQRHVVQSPDWGQVPCSVESLEPGFNLCRQPLGTDADPDILGCCKKAPGVRLEELVKEAERPGLEQPQRHGVEPIHTKTSLGSEPNAFTKQWVLVPHQGPVHATHRW